MPTLKQRRKWETAVPNLKVGDPVLLPICPYLKSLGQRRWESRQGGSNDLQERF